MTYIFTIFFCTAVDQCDFYNYKNIISEAECVARIEHYKKTPDPQGVIYSKAVCLPVNNRIKI